MQRTVAQISLGKDPPPKLADYRRELADCLAREGRTAEACAELQTLLTGHPEPDAELSLLCKLANLQVPLSRSTSFRICSTSAASCVGPAARVCQFILNGIDSSFLQDENHTRSVYSAHEPMRVHVSFSSQLKSERCCTGMTNLLKPGHLMPE